MLKSFLSAFVFSGATLFSVLSFAQGKIEFPSQQVIESQILAFKAKEHEQAFSFASPRLQVIFRDVENFIRMVRNGYEPIYSARSWKFGRTKQDGSTIHHEVMISGPSGRDWVALYSLQKQDDGSWRIISVRLLKAPGAGA
ncbi:MAG: DUF4864 domain-containing protein [Pseudomonadota bacterium]